MDIWEFIAVYVHISSKTIFTLLFVCLVWFGSQSFVSDLNFACSLLWLNYNSKLSIVLVNSIFWFRRFQSQIQWTTEISNSSYLQYNKSIFIPFGTSKWMKLARRCNALTRLFSLRKSIQPSVLEKVLKVA